VRADHDAAGFLTTRRRHYNPVTDGDLVVFRSAEVVHAARIAKTHANDTDRGRAIVSADFILFVATTTPNRVACL